MKYVPRTLIYLLPYWPLAATSVGVTVLAVLASLLAPWPLKILVDNVLGSQPLPSLLTPFFGPLASSRSTLLVVVVLAGFGVTLIENLLAVFNEYLHTKLNQNMTLDFRSDLFRHAEKLSMSYHDERRSGMLIYAINFQASAAPNIIMAILPLAQSTLTLVGMVIISLKIDTELALVSLVVVPGLYFLVGYYATHIQERLRHVKGLEGESLAIIHEALSMLRVIVAFVREQYEFLRFRAQGQKAVDARVDVTVRQMLFSLAVNVITAIGTALVLGIGASHVLQGQLTLGQMLVVMAYVASVYKPLESISYTIGSLQDQFVALNMAFGVLDTKREIADEPGARTIARAAGRLRFENVRFSYNRRVDTLKDIAFEIGPGDVLAIVGPTGAGKTTLVNLIPRFYEPQGGRILIDEIDLRAVTLESLREQISIVLQEPLLFSGTVASNIRYGRLNATQDEVIAAAKEANAHDFIVALPQKYDTPVGERGAQLSGGERQRICVARAFLRDAPILILDEPTSSIDSRTEAVILESLERLMAGRTTIMIAHRLSTIRRADQILVLDHGRQVDRGTHEELMARGGLYRQLYEIQMGRAQSNGQVVHRVAFAKSSEE